MTSRGISRPACWFCAARLPRRAREVETVIESRAAADGGPFRTLTCRGCRTQCGALRNRRGEWLLYPLEGATEPTLIDRIVPRTSRAHSARARQWWLRNAGNVERFRDANPSRARGADAAPPETARAATRAAAADPGAAAARTGPRAVLGVAADATLADVKRAWRAAVKRWHRTVSDRRPGRRRRGDRRFQECARPTRRWSPNCRG